MLDFEFQEVLAKYVKGLFRYRSSKVSELLEIKEAAPEEGNLPHLIREADACFAVLQAEDTLSGTSMVEALSESLEKNGKDIFEVMDSLEYFMRDEIESRIFVCRFIAVLFYAGLSGDVEPYEIDLGQG